MASGWGMDIDEYSDRSVEIGKRLMTICGDLYAAIDDKVSLIELNGLLAEGEKKIELFEGLLLDVAGSQHAEVIKSYGDYIDRIRKYSKQLREIYHS